MPIFTKGKLPDGKPVAMQGISPIKVAYLTAEKSKEFSKEPSQWMSVIPTVYNADTLGIRPDLISRPIDSWAQLLDPEFKGKAAILDIPSIGIMDAAMAIEAAPQAKSQGHQNHRNDGCGEDCVRNEDGEVEKPDPSLAAEVNRADVNVIVKITNEKNRRRDECRDHRRPMFAHLTTLDEMVSASQK